MTSKVKTAPCEGCRERKKKCSLGVPCVRCVRLGINCQYLKSAPPPDLDYLYTVESYKLEANVKELERYIASLEGEIRRLKRSSVTMHPECSSSTDSIITRPTTNWQLTLGEYGLRIDTDIRSCDDLLQRIRAFGMLSGMPPLYKRPSSCSSALPGLQPIPRYAVSTHVRHTHFRAIHRCVETNNVQPALDPGGDAFRPAKDLPLRLFEIYFLCRAHYTVDLHRPTFYALFVNNAGDLEDSPVACALCADILTMRCRRVQGLVPFQQQIEARTYYYRRARELIGPRFDEVTLVSYLTYLFLARHFTNLVYPKMACRYMTMALRIRHLLAAAVYSGPRSTDTMKAGEAELFWRSHAIIYYVGVKIQFYNNQRGVPMRSMAALRRKTRLMSAELRQEITGVLSQAAAATPLPDETAAETRYRMHAAFSETIWGILRPFLTHSRSPSIADIPVELFVRTEQSLSRYFYKEVPPSHRLQLSIFEDDLTDNAFRERIRNDPSFDACSAMLTIRYYEGLIALHEPFLPTLPERCWKPRHADEFTMRAFAVCYRSAVMIVRLLECLIMDEHMCCDMMTASFLTAWDIHVRNACLGFADPEKAHKYVPVRVVKTSRDYVIRCIHLFRKGYHYDPADRLVWEDHQAMEDEFFRALFATRPYVSEYGDPWTATTTTAW
ncbi:hypothetical protein BX666DRAFT_2162758 [Dichotomocladium elegans]|nr:hypothetical protein BX666DRAFT_2162758 [Dichotomocladium elegans]